MAADLPFELNLTVGALELGAIISNLLGGFFVMQVFVYYQNFPHDRWQLKGLVTFVWLMELANTVCVMHGIYAMTVLRHGRIDVMTVLRHGRIDVVVPQSLRISFYLNCMIITVVQVSYAYRLSKCFSKPYCACICLVLTFFQCLAFLIFLAEWEFQSSKLMFVSVAGFYAAGAADLFIALFLCHYLIKNRRNSFQTRTIGILDRLIVMTIATGLIMGAMSAAIGTLVLTASSYSAWYAALALFDNKISSNLMLLSLNRRLILREMQEQEIRTNRMGASHSLDPSYPIELSTHVMLETGFRSASVD